MLYAFGSNGSGQLGVGHTQDLSTPTATIHEGAVGNGRLKAVAAGGNHTLLLYEDGFVQATGNNEDGRCGIQGVHQLTSFTNVPLPFVSQIAATWSSTTILTFDGALYVCGTGKSGELGLGDGVDHAASWTKVPLSLPGFVTRCFSGMAHTIIVLSNGDLYGWGKGRQGQLGQPAQDIWSPRKITGIDFHAHGALCGKDFTLAYASTPERDDVQIIRSSENDRFGIKANAPPSPLEPYGTLNKITASWGSVVAIMYSGSVLAWGRNDHGQLPPPSLTPFEKISGGSEHFLGVTATGKLLAWGWGEHGNCGSPTDDRGDVKDRWNEIEVPGNVQMVFAGCATSFVLTDE